jgi:L-seryl-tRNA(Ser) seleniumtransferase
MNLQDLPRVDELAGELTGLGLPRQLAITVARETIEAARREIRDGATADAGTRAHELGAMIAATHPTRIINATGVLLHTNLGRAILPASAATTATETAVAYSNVELDIGTGRRGGRAAYAGHLLRALTGAEAALVVNNNAGALLLALAAIAGSGNAIVSRGEEIEIGGSFRLPELMAASGCRLVEVGTTNRTRVADYEGEIEAAAAILKVHPSNYRVQGFAEAASIEELAALGRAHGVPLIADIGSGLLDANVPWFPGSPPAWLSGEPAVRQTLERGADVVLFSGDKLLGGPQAGIAVGHAELIRKMSRHPMARAVRIDGPTHAALVGTLELYADDRGHEIPFWAMVMLGYEELETRHQTLLEKLGGRGRVGPGESLPGAGSVPGETIRSPNLYLDGDADEMFARLLAARPPILARRREGRLIIDLRTVAPEDDMLVAEALT